MMVTGQQMFDFIITLINFTIMFMIFRLVVIIPMQEAVRLREQRVKLRLSEIEELAESARERKEEFEVRFGDFDSTVQGIREGSERLVSQASARIAEQAEQEEKFLLAKAQAEADALRREAEKEIRTHIVTLAIARAEEMISDGASTSVHNDVISASIEKVGGLRAS